MKKHLSMLVCLAALAGLPAAPAPAQDLGRPADTVSNLDRLRGDADDARRREADLAAQVATQEKVNATLREQIRRAGNDPSGLARDLADASDQAATLRKKVADQRQRRDAAEEKLAAARDRAMRQFEQTDAMKAARKSVADAAAELDRLSQPIFEQLTQTPAYTEQQAIVEAAAQTGEALQPFGDGAAQAQADAAFDQAMAGLRTLEDAAVAADPSTAEARKSLKVAQDTFDGIRTANETKISSDPQVDAARFALDLEQRLMDDASAQLATAEKRLSALRQAGGAQGAANELANQLREGEDKLRDLTDRLDQARIARRDADDRLAATEDALARRPAGSAEPGVDAPPPAVYEPAPVYSGAEYYGGGTYVYPPTYGYGYVYPRYGPYYSYDYCPPYFSSGLFLGFGYVSHPWWYHRHYYHHHHDHHHHGYYGGSHYRGYDGGNRFRDGYRNTVQPLPRDSRYATSDRRYDYARFNSTEVRRDRDARAGIDAARRATADVERDYRYRTGVSTYDYPGSSRTLRPRDLGTTASRQRAYDADTRGRRGTSSLDDARTSRAPILADPNPGRSTRSDDASDARRSRAADETARARGDSQPRGTDSGARSSAPRSTRPPETAPPAARPSPGTSTDARRSRVTETPSAESSAARARASEEASARARSSDESSRRARAAEETSRARSASDAAARGGRSTPTPDAPRVSPRPSAPAPVPSPAPDRGSRGGGSSGVRSPGPSSFDRGSSRGSAPAPSVPSAPSAGRGSRGGDGGGGSISASPSRGGGGSSSAGSSRGGGGSSSSSSSSSSSRGGGDSGGRRGR